MMLRFRVTALFAVLMIMSAGLLMAENWPQFRGVNATGIAGSASHYPAKIGPATNVKWKVDVPPGHSSPIVFGDRIFLTAERDEKLVTVALDRTSGALLWEVEAPHKTFEKVHSIGSHCQSSPATDGEHVVSLFGSCGLFCYDSNGKLLWQRPMGPFNNDFGAGSSPIIESGRVIVCQDHDTDSFMVCLDLSDGKELWRVDRREFPRNYCTPVILNHDGKKQIVVAATLRVVGYDFETGEELWTVRGISRTVCMTPAVGGDGNLYVAGWAAGGDSDEPIRVEPYADVITRIDANKNGAFEESELPEGAIKQRFSQVDRDKNGAISKEEYEYMRSLFDLGKNVVMAIRPGGAGDVSKTHVIWENRRFVPFCASPLYYEGIVFAVKDGGIFSTWDAKSGKALKQGRIPGTGSYYSSPVAADHKVYVVNEEGKLTVLKAAGDWSVISTAEFGEDVYATPALVAGRVYVRTKSQLFCFAE